MRGCSNNRDQTPLTEPIITAEVKVKWDTLKIDSLVYIPRWRTKIETIHDTIPADIDTLDILKDYYAKYFYTDTLDLDSLGNIVISDTISQNSIVFREIQPNVLIPTTTITNTVYINNREFYGGFGIKGKSDQLNYLGGELLFKTKNKQAYSIGVGVNQEFQPVLGFGMYWKIGK
jgi:hypothetical protein|tara:strand:- start:155 stop:679 length:525 start_codon:yes stop_codon:yes gene_type:complete